MAKSTKSELKEIISLYKKGNLDVSLNKALRLKKIEPRNVHLLNALGVIYRSLMKWDLAILQYDKILKSDPKNATYLNNKANVLRDCGRLKEATDIYNMAIKGRPTNATYWCNLAKVLNDRYLFDQAERAATKANQLAPSNIDALNNLGLALEGQKKIKLALAIYNKAYSIAPENAIINNNLGNLYFQLSNLKKAIWHVKQSIILSPKLVRAHSNLCEIYEKTNDIRNFKIAVNNALKLTNNHAEIMLKKGQLQFRNKQYKQSISTLQSFIETEIPEAKRAVLFEILAKNFDFCGNYEKAFIHFNKMNFISSKQVGKLSINPRRYSAYISKLKTAYNINFKEYQSKSTSKSSKAPIFIIGFPRSGTTLLDTILRSHEMIDVIEEQPLVDKMVFEAGKFVDSKLLHQLSQTQIMDLEKTYNDQLDTLLPDRNSKKLLIDKFPLNIVNAPLIQKVFPKAKFILVLRHPYDCVLSCFMQNFQLNDAMANFLDLKMTSHLYSEIMTLWEIYSKGFDLQVRTIKYENLINDFENTAKNVLEFLRLDWDQNLKHFHETGLKRARISTPSYNQVTEKLYLHAKDRWKNYLNYIGTDLKPLDQWVAKLDY